MASNIRLNILGDESHLRRAFANATRDAKKFAAQTDSTFARSANKSASAYNTAFSRQGRSALIGGLAGGAAVIAAAQIARQLKQTIAAAAEAQNVLGQTKVALEDTGASWLRYGSQIERAVGDQSKLGFDDEALLKTFSLFQRSTEDVTKSLTLNALATDVARGRYIDLESAALLVLKASMGQSGALRRVGIDAKQGASGVELLTMLTEKYGGAAARAGSEATGSYDRLKVSLENVQETIGSGALPILTDFAVVLSEAADQANALGAALKDIDSPGGGSLGKWIGTGLLLGPTAPALLGTSALANFLKPDKSKGAPDIAAAADAFRADVPGVPTKQKSLADRLRIAGFVPAAKAGSPTTTLSNRIRGSLLDAQRTSGSGDDLKVLGRAKQFLLAALGQSGLKPGQQVNLKQELAAVLGDIKGIQDAAAQKLLNAAEKAAQKIADAESARRLKSDEALLDAQRTPGTKDDLAVLATAKAVLQATLKDRGLKLEDRVNLKQELAGVLGDIKTIQEGAAAKLKEAAEELKKSAIDKLDLFRSGRDNARDLADARARMTLANQIGGPEGIKLATRDLEDAKLERQRLALQGVTWATSRGPQQITGTAAGSIVININGSTLNEAQLTNAVVTALEKRRKKTTPQTRGRHPGQRPY